MYFARQLYATIVLFLTPLVIAAWLGFHGAPSIGFLVWSALVAAVLTIYGYNIGTHYAFAHRAFIFPRWSQILLIYVGTIAACASPLSWASLHSVHHRHVDTANDPHAPSRLGWRALFMTNYTSDAVTMMSVRHLVSDPMQVFADSNLGFWSITLSWPFLMMMFFGPDGLVYLWLLPLWYVIFVAVAFVFSHTGAHDAKSNSHAINSWLLQIISLGDGNHLDHHRNARSYGFGTWLFAKSLGA